MVEARIEPITFRPVVQRFTNNYLMYPSCQFDAILGAVGLNNENIFVFMFIFTHFLMQLMMCTIKGAFVL
jgi:hypothetical protein